MPRVCQRLVDLNPLLLKFLLPPESVGSNMFPPPPLLFFASRPFVTSLFFSCCCYCCCCCCHCPVGRCEALGKEAELCVCGMLAMCIVHHGETLHLFPDACHFFFPFLFFSYKVLFLSHIPCDKELQHYASPPPHISKSSWVASVFLSRSSDETRLDHAFLSSLD